MALSEGAGFQLESIFQCPGSQGSLALIVLHCCSSCSLLVPASHPYKISLRELSIKYDLPRQLKLCNKGLPLFAQSLYALKDIPEENLRDPMIFLFI